MSFDDLFTPALAAARSTAYHLEQRDAYSLAEVHRGSFVAYTADRRVDLEFMAGWEETIRKTVARGVEVRRLRIVSEPITDYIRWEHAITVSNLAAGESVRWLSRRAVPAVAVPPWDFWIFDGASVLVNHFAGDGSWPEPAAELRTEPDLAKLVAESFDAAWSAAIPHDLFHPE